MKYIKYLSIIIFIFSFLLLRPYHLQKTGLIYAGDDQSYFAQATSLAFFEFPSYKKEGYFVGDGSPMHSIGPGILAAPFVFLFSQIDRLQGSSIVVARAGSDIFGSWSAFGFLISTYFYFYVGWLLLFLALRYYFEDKIAFLSVLFMIFVQLTPLYVFRRPIFSHIYEFFLACSFIYLLLKNNKENIIDKKYSVILVGLITGLIYLVRNNNLFVSLIMPLVLICFGKDGISFKGKSKQLLAVYGIAAFLVFVFKGIPALLYGEHYSEIAKALLRTYSPLTYVKRILHIIFGIDWGLLYTAPFALAGFTGLFLLKDRTVRNQLLLLCVPILFNLYIVIVWGEHGSFYGYRYLFFSLAPLIVFPFADLLNRMKDRFGFHKVLITCCIISILPIMPMLCFEGNATNLTMHKHDDYFWYMGFAANDTGNKTFQIEVWKTFILQPKEFFTATLKAGPLYAVYIGSLVFKLTKYLPSEVIAKYQSFNITLLIRVIIIYIFPFFMYLIAKKIFDNDNLDEKEGQNVR
ncbi:hypothetical protein ACFL58_03495 [Elusimicrobiota bacterium]